LDDYCWLVSEAARRWLAAARQELAGGDVAAAVARLRKDLSAERTHLVVEQVELRERAKDKFALAEKMFFTRKGLEQATDEQVAAAKATRFAAGKPHVDLCCGIGGDLLAMAARGSAVGVDADAVAALLGSANLAAGGVPSSECRVEVGDAATADVSQYAAWHCDPDRRAGGRRTTAVERFSPSLQQLDRLLQRGPDAAVKLAPATVAPRHWAEQAELQWLGSRGECRQQVAWFGELAAHPGRRSATIVDAAGQPRTVVGAADSFVPVAAGLGRYLYEPHATVLAAGLLGAMCQQHGLEAVAAQIAYLTGERWLDDPALAGFEVCEVLPLDTKKLRAYCREHRVGRL
jgi:hypothetical protein